VLREHSGSTSLRILIAGNDCIFQRGFASILCDILPCAEFVQASCFHDAKAWLGREVFSAAIFDINVKDRNGPIGFQMLRADHPHLILGVLSHIDNASVILSYLAAGVNGYILGCSSQSEIERAIKAIFRGAIYVPPNLIRSKGNQTDHDTEAPPLCRDLKGLTGRQSAVLDLLLNGHSNKEIARELRLSPHTIKIHVGAVLRHFAVRRRTELTVAVRRCDSDAYRHNDPSRPSVALPLN
jgi:two-component system nitrate/nitrite response regulator NarL